MLVARVEAGRRLVEEQERPGAGAVELRDRASPRHALAQIWEPTAEDASEAGNRYLLLDEPTASLDLGHQHGVLSVARRFAAEGAGVLAVLHDLNLAAQYADQLVILAGGTVLTQGAAADVLTPAAIQAAFGMPVLVQPHPCHDCPLIIPTPEGVSAPAASVVSALSTNSPMNP